MGYCVTMEITNAVIPKKYVPGALAAINALHTEEMLSKHASGGRYGGEPASVKETKWYSWVPNPDGDGFASLPEAINAWRYACDEINDGDIEITCFIGDKLGDDAIFWGALAPWVSEIAEVRCVGEDGYRWRWTFDYGILSEDSMVSVSLQLAKKAVEVLRKHGEEQIADNLQGAINFS